ncbi:GT-D fold domain-containing glycosyltransferase [Paenibacillus sp. JX-17]|uniref:GT-D fold domain-containing glycosyltransferase n=1 Tax=Paenibacillus lacisoli TaxID=3064525 RepID=A0ABT9CCK7_9BACL|nr:GT-D fold domain-containing glycosyltransferase [Paenibacillus sp. JX-17]MDO7906996.1 GT-D fold domain-containing glycosyltransferase [Paenibacillus sp. JX-17]
MLKKRCSSAGHHSQPETILKGSALGGPYSSKVSPASPKGPADSTVSSDQSQYLKGYRDGRYDGAEGIVASLLPPLTILPEFSAADLIKEGFRQNADKLYPLLTVEQVYERLDEGIHAGRPLSLIRLGDGELLTLAYGTVLQAGEADSFASFLPYAGVPRPTPQLQSRLAESIRRADLVGIPEARLPTYQGLLFPVLQHFGLPWRELCLTSSAINYMLQGAGLLLPLLQGRKVLVAGNKAEGLAEMLVAHGVLVTGVIRPVRGFEDVDAVVAQAEAVTASFDIALVAAGVPAVVICEQIASRLGRTALDIGHLADKLASGELQLQPVPRSTQ